MRIYETPVLQILSVCTQEHVSAAAFDGFDKLQFIAGGNVDGYRFGSGLSEIGGQN